MSGEGGSFWKTVDTRSILIVVLAIVVVIGTLLYFVDRPMPRRAEEAPIQIALTQAGPVWLGADVEDITPDMVTKLELHATTGVYVRKVFRDSPAELAGLKRDDVITSVDSVKVASVTELASVIAAKKDGDRIKIRVMRNDAKQSVNVKLKLKISENKIKQKVTTKLVAAPGAPGTNDANADAWLGVDVQSLDAVLVRQLKLPDTRGAIVAHVFPGSPAAQSGLVRGDVIRSLDKMPVNDRTGFSELLMNKNPGDSVKLEVLRNGFAQDVVVVAGTMPVAAVGEPPQLPAAEVEVEVSWLGLTIVVIDPLEAKELGLPSGTKGMAVDGVSIGVGLDAGFQAGDIIIAINGMPTRTLREFKDATEGAQGALVDVWRAGRHRFVTVAAPGWDRDGNQLPNSSAATQVAQALPVDNGMRYVAVAAMGNVASSPVSPIFSKSPFFIIVDLKKGMINPIANPRTEATGITAAKWLMNNHIDAVITGRIGPRAFDVLTGAKIPVYAGAFGPTADLVQAFREGKLKPSLIVLGSTPGDKKW
ncbi:PDZ domain-containing protein [Bdellovibrionota bacterium FG-1]